MYKDLRFAPQHVQVRWIEVSLHMYISLGWYLRWTSISFDGIVKYCLLSSDFSRISGNKKLVLCSTPAESHDFNLSSNGKTLKRKKILVM